MKAVYVTQPGGPEVLELREVGDPPQPAGSQILVRVRAAGLNRADLLQRRGMYQAPEGTKQEIPGLEFAGEVVAVGDQARRFSPGDRVMGITSGEAQAELLIVDESLAVPIADGLSYTQAAAVPEVFVTAHDAIVTQGKLDRGDWLLIHAIGSGVGLAALQIAKAMGAKVIGTSRTADKLAAAVELGLDESIETGDGAQFSERVVEMTGGRGADVILDLVGGGYFPENVRSVAVKGHLLIIGLTAGRKAEVDLGAVLSKRLTIIGSALRSRPLDEKAVAVAAFERDVLPAIASGEIKVVVDRVFSAPDVGEAHRYMESNANFGKIILEF